MKSLNTNKISGKRTYTRANYIKYYPTLFKDLNHEKGEVHLSHIELFNYSDKQIIKAFEIMNKNEECYYMIYSYHIDRANELSGKIKWSDNIGLVTQLNETNTNQVIELMFSKAKGKFIDIQNEFIRKHPNLYFRGKFRVSPISPLLMLA